MMRSLSRFALIGLATFALSAPVVGQRPDNQITPRSVQLQRQGQASLGAGKLDSAQDMFETALAVDPRNRGAYVDLARVAERQKLFGKAIRLTNKALAMEPNDPDAIAVQGQAMVGLGAVARAGQLYEAAGDLPQGLPAAGDAFGGDQSRPGSRLGQAPGKPQIQLA